jgi:hypothetical protein
MKGESAKQNLLRHPPGEFRRRAIQAQEEADRLAVIWWAVGLTFLTALLLVFFAWVAVGL